MDIDMGTDISNLLILPDEMLLEICKYLLNAHVLYSFYGINERFNRCIVDYYRHLFLTDITFDQSHYVYRSILPEISHHIHSISINNCRSILQGKVFLQYFSGRMSKIFPNLRKLILTCFAGDELDAFLNTLTDLNELNQIEIDDLLSDGPDLFQHVVEANNNRFSSITFKTSYLHLPNSPCLNILNLTISIQKLYELPILLSFIPNIRRLNATIDEANILKVSFDELSPLLHMNYFFLRCYNYFWSVEEISTLLQKLPAVENLSLQISSQDKGFVVSEQAILDILPKPIQQFNFSLRYFYDTIEEINQNALLASRFPITCLIDENLQQAHLHTIPYRFPLLNVSVPMAKQMLTYNNYRNVEMFYDYHGMSIAESFPIISRCHRVREIAIELYDKDDELPLVQQQLPSLPNLFYLKRIWLLHSSREYQSVKSLLQIAPNLSELFIAFDNLLPMFDDQDTCQLLQNRIIHLLILRSVPTAPNQITEEHIPRLVQIFTRVRHLQIDVTKGPLIESIILSVMNAFKNESKLVSLVVEGESSSDELKSNARQWLIDHTHLTNDGKFDAEFKKQTNRFLLWM